MKKIMHLIFTLETGGAENMLIDIANEQSIYADITLILINRKSNSELIQRLSPAVRLYSLQREEGNKRSILFLFKLWTLLLRINPAVIHCHDHKIVRLLPFFRKRAVLTVHCVTVPTEHFSKYRKVYAISQAVSYEVMRSGIDCSIVNNGINFKAIVQKAYYKKDCPVSENHLSENNLAFKGLSSNYIGSIQKSLHYLNESLSTGNVQTQQSRIRLVQIARLKHEMKGQDLLITALGLILNSSPGLNVTVDFIGCGKSETLLRKMTKDLGLDKSVTFLAIKAVLGYIAICIIMIY